MWLRLPSSVGRRRTRCGRRLRERLPDYMVPSAVCGAGAPAADAQRQGRPARAAGAAVRPRQPRLARMWRPATRSRSRGRSLARRARSSNRSACTITSSSWAAIRCWPRRLSRVWRKLLKLDLPLQRFFETATVSALAAELQKKLGAGEARASRSHCAGAPHGQSAAVVCPAAAVVSGPAVARQGRLQHSRGMAAERCRLMRRR